MSRPRAFEESKLIELFRSGLSDREIADKTPYTVRSIENNRYKYRRDGTLDQPIKQYRRGDGRGIPREVIPTDPYEFNEKMIEVFQKAKQADHYKAEAEKYKKGYNNMKEYATKLEKDNKKKDDQKLRYKQALQQGDVKEPL